MAARDTSGSLRGGGCEQAGAEEAGGFLHEAGIGRIPSGGDAGVVVLRLCHGGVFEPEVGASQLRFGGGNYSGQWLTGFTG